MVTAVHHMQRADLVKEKVAVHGNENEREKTGRRGRGGTDRLHHVRQASGCSTS